MNNPRKVVNLHVRFPQRNEETNSRSVLLEGLPSTGSRSTESKDGRPPNLLEFSGTFGHGP